jgi:membrane fusion protein (multidrug efflux system)
MRVWKQLLILLLLASAGVLGFVGNNYFFSADADPNAGKRTAKPTVIEVDAAREKIVSRTIEAVGTTRALNSVEIRPLATGTVRAISFKPGKVVSEGTVLVKLDDEIQRADLAEAEAVVTEQRSSEDRMQQLRRRNAVAPTSLEQAAAKLAVAEAALQRAKRRLSDRTIRAPFAGVVGLTNIEVGARVDTDTMITRLDNLTEVEVEFSLPEMLFGQVAIGKGLTAISSAFPGRSFKGKISEIDSRVDAASRSFKVRAHLPNPDGALPAGMFLSLQLTLEEKKALVVSEEAIVVQAADTYVFIVDKGKSKRVSVKTGLRQDGEIVILSGLSSGDQVITRGLQRVKDNGPVKIKGDDAADKKQPRNAGKEKSKS